jgi:uncharacterized membrane protein YcaP (DUF421 family)
MKSDPMNPILRGAAIYLFLLLVLRMNGKRAFSQMTTFDFVLLLILGEATQQALMGDDYSLTSAVLVINTLIVLDWGLSWLKDASPRAARMLESLPLLIVRDGQLLRDRMERERLDEEDILNAARELRGLERLDQVKHAVLERDGRITIVPADTAQSIRS